MAHMPQVQVPQMHPFQAAYNQVSLDPRVQMSNPSSTEQSFLNSSFGSNSSVFNSDEETMMLKTNYTSLKSKYSELKVLKDRCYRDASDFKKKLQQSEFRIKDLEHKNSSLKKDNDYCHKKNESLTREVTALKTEFNKRNISL
jgi:septal ring factor EnvC (AmiA/AmiB activator)